MPSYTYECEPCKTSQTVDCKIAEMPAYKMCTICRKRAPQTIGRPMVINFRAGFYEHVSQEGAYCETPQQLQDACNKNGGISDYLENSSFKTRTHYDPDEYRHKSREADRKAVKEELVALPKS